MGEAFATVKQHRPFTDSVAETSGGVPLCVCVCVCVLFCLSMCHFHVCMYVCVYFHIITQKCNFLSGGRRRNELLRLEEKWVSCHA